MCSGPFHSENLHVRAAHHCRPSVFCKIPVSLPVQGDPRHIGAELCCPSMRCPACVSSCTCGSRIFVSRRSACASPASPSPALRLLPRVIPFVGPEVSWAYAHPFGSAVAQRRSEPLRKIRHLYTAKCARGSTPLPRPALTAGALIPSIVRLLILYYGLG